MHYLQKWKYNNIFKNKTKDKGNWKNKEKQNTKYKTSRVLSMKFKDKTKQQRSITFTPNFRGGGF